MTNYRLTFLERNREPYYFQAGTDEEAEKIAVRKLGIEGYPTAESFFKHGGNALEVSNGFHWSVIFP